MDTYTQFLTLRNVRDFVLYIYGNNLTNHEHFADFIHTLNKHKYIGSTCNSCRQSYVDCYNENFNSWLGCCMIGMCCPCIVSYECISDCLCKNSKHNFDEYMKCCVFGCDGLLNGDCCVKTKCTFLERVRDLLLHADYRDMLQNYPPYVEHCIKSWIFRIPHPIICNTFGDISTYQKQYRLHVNSLPIDETYDEFALCSFVLCPENQLQILSHALTFGKRCCKTCGILDENQDVVFDTRYTYECHYATFLPDNNWKHRYKFANVIFARFLCCFNNQYFPNFHKYLLHLIPYRDFLHIYTRRAFRFMLVHEETFANFDRNNVGHHVFCNEYIVRIIHQFL